MKGFLSILFPEKYSGYERSLERIERSLRAANGNLSWYEGVRKRVQKWTWAFFVLSLCASLVWVFKVKQEAAGMSALQHFKHVATALAVPVVVELLRRVAVGTISLWTSFGRRRTKRLEQQKQSILKELKDASNYERIAQIIEKYDPNERAKLKARAAALASPASGSRRGRTLSGGIKPGPSPMRGAAVVHFLQSTGQALSPMVDRIASALDDEPSRKAAIRQLVVERDSLKGEVASLRHRLSQYEDVYAQENMPPAMPLLEGPDAGAQQLNQVDGNDDAPLAAHAQGGDNVTDSAIANGTELEQEDEGVRRLCEEEYLDGDRDGDAASAMQDDSPPPVQLQEEPVRGARQRRAATRAR